VRARARVWYCVRGCVRVCVCVCVCERSERANADGRVIERGGETPREGGKGKEREREKRRAP